MEDKPIVLCGANAYTEKYYFNDEFDSLPEGIKKELQIMCVWFVQEIGGIFLLEFAPDGTLEFKTEVNEYDGSTDEIGSYLKIKQIREERRELLESLEMYFKVFFLGENADILEDEGESYEK